MKKTLLALLLGLTCAFAATGCEALNLDGLLDPMFPESSASEDVTESSDDNASDSVEHKHVFGEEWTENKTDATHVYTCECGYTQDVECNCNLWDGESVDTEGLAANTDNEAKTVSIATAAQFAAFAKSVNVDGNTYVGYTVTLTENINLNDMAWTPIGQTGSTEFKGVFDGQNHIILNLSIDSSEETGANYSSGLFGWIEGHSDTITVKNVIVKNAEVVGHHNVAVIAGYVTGTARIENCIVKNAEVVNTHANDDACGDKTGLIAGYANVAIVNCHGYDSTVATGRDGGQLIGAGSTALVTECTATNVTVSATEGCTGNNVNEAVIGRVLG